MTQAEVDGPVVEVSRLSRHFGTRLALDQVSLTVQPGQVFGVVGENGAGKTTLIKHLLGLYRAQTGSVRVFGEDPVAQPERVLGGIGYLSEEPELPGWMTVAEFLRYNAAFYPRWDQDYAATLVKAFGLDPAQPIRDLSKGKRAQAGLCAAQAHRPQLLLLDEPSSGLDPIVRRDILAAIIRTVVDEGRTVIFSSHLLDEVERVSDHLLMLSHGRVLLCDSMDNVLTRHYRLTVRLNGHRPALEAIDGFIGSRAIGEEWRVDCYGELERLAADLQRSGAELLAHRCLPLAEIFMARSDHVRSGGG